MAQITRESLAERSGVSVHFLDRLVELGILTTGDSEPAFSSGDLRRVRLFNGLDQGGLPLEAVGTAVRNGDLSFAFFDVPYWERFGGLVGKTLRELSEESGLSLEMLLRVRIGLHTGEPVREADDFYAKAVILAARIAAEARGSEILVSALVRELTESAGEFGFEEPTDAELKGLSGMHHLSAIRWRA